ALAHISANALLRCYQLLVSPSAVAYLLRQQSTLGVAQVSDERSIAKKPLPRRLLLSLYVFSISEGYLENAVRSIFWIPLQKAGWAHSPSKTLAWITGSGILSASATYIALRHSYSHHSDWNG